MLSSTFQANQSTVTDATPVGVERGTITTMVIAWVTPNFEEYIRWKRLRKEHYL